MSRRHLITGILAGVLLAAPTGARADWLLYLSAHLGTASGTTSIAGSSNLGGNPLPFLGTYTDSSPLIAGAVGIAIPLDETTAWELPYDLRLPTWPLRFEVEATGLRSFEGFTLGPGSLLVFGGTDTWSVMVNLFQDVPLSGLSRPLSWLPGRTPRWITHTLDQMHIYAGAGIGAAGLQFNFFDNVHTAQSNATQFAWQAGTGLTYALTKVVALDIGYRFFDYGNVVTDYQDRALVGVVRGPFSLEQTSHEFRGGIRVNFWGFQPWR